MNEKLYNLKKLNEISQGDGDFVRSMVVTFVENVTVDIDKIRSLISVNDWTAIGEKAHKLASNFAYLGANILHDLAAEIEKSVLMENNLTGVAVKTEKMCHNGMILVGQLEKDFDL